MGNERDALEALGRAEEFLAHLTEETVSSSALGYNEGQLQFHQANALTRLQNDARAEVAQERALALCSSRDYLDRTLILLDAAERQVRRGDVGGALELASHVLGKLSNAQRVGVIRIRVRELARVLPAPAGASATVRQFRELVTDTVEDES